MHPSLGALELYQNPAMKLERFSQIYNGNRKFSGCVANRTGLTFPSMSRNVRSFSSVYVIAEIIFVNASSIFLGLVTQKYF